MVKLGVYALMRVGFDLLGGGASWWWLLVATVGAMSALYGIMQAVVATDVKRLLAFSTSENIGLILLGVGFAGMLTKAGQPAAAAVALAASLLHAVNHAGFKTLLFFGAGSIVKATGTRDLDKLGGLSRRMPTTTVLVAAGALGAAALPPGNGFVSEWLLLQAILHPSTQAGTLLAIAAPVAVAVVALTAGVGVAAYVKAVGTGFLARPRSDAAALRHRIAAEHACGHGCRGGGVRGAGRGSRTDRARPVPHCRRREGRTATIGMSTSSTCGWWASAARSLHCGSRSDWSGSASPSPDWPEGWVGRGGGRRHGTAATVR